MPEIQNKSDDQKVAEAEVQGFRDDRGPFVVAAETTRMAMVFTDVKEPDHPIIFVNDSFLALSGYQRAEVLGQSFNFMVAHEDDARALAQIELAFKDAADNDGDLEICCRRKDGGSFWAAVFITPVRAKSGAVEQHFASFVDLTRHKGEQARSAMLIDELNHRVENTLATVQSIVWQSLRRSSDLKAIGESIESRIFALARSHDLLTRNTWEGAGLRDLVDAAMAPFASIDQRRQAIVVNGPNVMLPPGATLALGIALHELATNAVKYGALSNHAGSILIGWTINNAPQGSRLVLHWQEKDGPPVTPPSRQGFGSKVIERGLTHELGGTARLDYRADGLACTIDVPVPQGDRGG